MSVHVASNRLEDKRKDGSVNQINPVSDRTLADVIAAISAHPELGSRERRDLLSALNRLSVLTRSPAATIPLDIGVIRDLLGTIKPAAVGLSARTIRNVRSGVFRAVERSGLLPVWRNQKADWSEDWKRLHDTFGSTGRPSHQFHVLRRFATWCSVAGIAPAAVDDDVLARFAAEMEASAARHCNGLTRDIARKWGEVRACHPELGLSALSIPTTAHRNRRLHLAALPGSFHAELDGYCAYLRCDDPLADDARPRALRASSVTSERQALLTLANGALAKGIDPVRLSSLDGLLGLDIAKEAFRFLLERAGGKTTGGVERARKALLALARYRLRDAPERVMALKNMLRKIPSLRPGMTPKNAALLREVSSADAKARLLGLPDRLFRRGMKRLDAHPAHALADVQTAIAIEVLLLHALRRKNLGALSWSRHIQWSQGDAVPSLLFIPGEEVKNGEPITRVIGNDLARMLVAYKIRVMPRAVNGTPDPLFCHPDGRPLSTDALVVRIDRAIEDLAGIKMTVHQFRHFSANLILDAHPGAYELARDHLGHASSVITQRFYAGGRQTQASQFFGDLIEEARAARPIGRSGKGLRLPSRSTARGRKASKSAPDGRTTP
jgi:integrase